MRGPAGRRLQWYLQRFLSLWVDRCVRSAFPSFSDRSDFPGDHRERDRENLINQHLASLRAIYARAIETGDLRTALAALRRPAAVFQQAVDIRTADAPRGKQGAANACRHRQRHRHEQHAPVEFEYHIVHQEMPDAVAQNRYAAIREEHTQSATSRRKQ